MRSGVSRQKQNGRSLDGPGRKVLFEHALET